MRELTKEIFRELYAPMLKDMQVSIVVGVDTVDLLVLWTIDPNNLK